MLNLSFKNSNPKRKKAIIFIIAFFLMSCVSIPKDVGITLIEFYDAYDPLFRSMDINFKIEYLNTDRENIVVKKNGLNWTITIFDGFIRHPKINKNGLKIGLCHEIGHLLAPRDKNALYASERSSDDYAILTCGIILKMDMDDLFDGIESIYQWYRLYPQQEKYPSAKERKDIMIDRVKRIYP